MAACGELWRPVETGVLPLPGDKDVEAEDESHSPGEGDLSLIYPVKETRVSFT